MTTRALDTTPSNAPAAVATTRSASKARLVYLDNLRMAVITGVVLMHVAIIYGAEGAWFYHEPGEKDTLIFVIMMLLGGIGTAFTMGLLFLIAGYFTPRAYDRKGTGPFVIDRFKRLGIPLILFEIFFLPLINYSVDVATGEAQSLIQYLLDHFRNLESFADGPVWFLEVLLIFSLCYALWRLVAARVLRRTPNDQRAEPHLPGNWAIAAFTLVIGVATFIVRIWALSGVYFEPWHIELAHAPQYIALFVAGLVAYRGNWLERFGDAQVRPWRWIALLFVLLMFPLVIAAGALSGQLDPRGAGGLNWLSLAYSLWEGFMCVSMVIVVLAWFRRRFNHQGRLAKLMSDNCFAVYILHPLIIIWLALALRGVQLNLGIKFLLVAPLAVVVCYLVAYLLRKIPYADRIL